MENQNYWDLFWQTGLPAAWLLSRAEEKRQAVAAFAPEEVSPEDSGTRPDFL